jgi:streptomycin 6-kinase
VLHDRPLPLPRLLVQSAELDEEMRSWVIALPDLVADAVRRWHLDVGEPFEPGGQTAWVAPVRTPAGEDAVLKVGWRHWEGECEANGLRAWDGRGAVRLIDSYETSDSLVMLLERCRPGEPLSSLPAEEQDTVLSGILRRLWSAPADAARFRPLEQMCGRWADSYEESPCLRLDPGLGRAGAELFRTLPLTAERHVLLGTDLHAGNVLSAQREPWLVIDPKPWLGDPAYDPLQHLLNHPERLGSDPLALSDRMARLCDLPPERLRLWLFARCVIGSTWMPALADVARLLAP